MKIFLPILGAACYIAASWILTMISIFLRGEKDERRASLFMSGFQWMIPAGLLGAIHGFIQMFLE